MTNDATRAQVDAAHPDASTWLAANAGSGKTRVLTDRVARLLLHGTQPQRILCLTYTKAAASEMQNRLFDRLGTWAMLDDAALVQALTELGETGDRDQLDEARRLFARAIETPGGLKIQTIHAFCASLLRRFPLESGVSLDFAEADERSLAQLRREVLDDLSQGPQAPLLAGAMAHLSEHALTQLLADISQFRDEFAAEAPDWHAVFDLPSGFDEAALERMVLTGDEGALIGAALPFLRASSKADVTLAAALRAVDTVGLRDLPLLESKFLNGKGAKEPFTAKKFATNAARTAMGPDLTEALYALSERLAEGRTPRMALTALRAAQAIHPFARLWIEAYDAAKARRRWLDFDDLIRLSRRLLENPSVAQWVLYKLDGGIDHILVDEAQDTSPQQWRVIQHLTQEFTAGLGARDTNRTVFVVGDRKQSIYSFQGADLKGFEATRADMGARMADSGQALRDRALRHSFRSSPAVLRYVDAVFAEPAETGLGEAPEHLAFHGAMPGRVDLWPVVPKGEKQPDGPWYDPVDRVDPSDPSQILARAIARQIRQMIDDGVQLREKDGERPVHEGDFLILVRTRSPLFTGVIRACKEQGLAIAGADRLVLTQELAVRDLIALLRFLALPEDDLSLAITLRSPLFAWSEAQLFALAHGRGAQSLWQCLRADPNAQQERAVLSDLLNQVDFLRPFELIDRVLTRHRGRARILMRLGDEVTEALEAFLDLALTYETGVVPSLDGFLAWLDASDAEIKRSAEAAGRRVRVMTIHGAKGLEAPIVILPDTAKTVDQERQKLVVAQGLALLRSNKDEATEQQLEADAARARARAEERDRLLYVALTRAESWLIIAAAGDVEAPEIWYERLRAAMGRLPASVLQTPVGNGWRHQHGTWPDPCPGHVPEAQAGAASIILPDLPEPVAAAGLLSPTALGGAKALPGEGADEDTALTYGSMVHAVLEGLCDAPVSSRAARAVAILETFSVDDATRARALAEVLALFDMPALAPYLGPDGLNECAICGDVDGRVMWGYVDRLVVMPDRVVVLDFKTNRVVPGPGQPVPEGVVRQMAAYWRMLGAQFGGKPVQAGILWTLTGQISWLESQAMNAALARAWQERP